MAVAEARIDAECNLSASSTRAKLVNHVCRAAVHWNLVFDHQIECFAVENVGRINDRRRLTPVGDVTGSQGPANLSRAYRIDKHPVTPHQVEDCQI